MNSWKITFLIVSVCIDSAIISAQTFVPFVIPAKQDPNSEIRFQYSPITEQDRLSAKDHFYSAKGRVRLWGVNFTFEANFPTHADAEQIAQRLACAGINSARMHHMDTMPWPRGIWNSDGKTLHPEALDRLDYFIDQLAMHGIYTDMNLHVGKEYSKTLGLPDSPENYDKMISIFTPQIIEAQKDYARQLLTHKNQYRPFTYADDPAIAIVEITNENSLFMWSAPQVLPNLPPFYADIIQKKYNQWLKSKYDSTDKMVAAWSADSVPLGPNKLNNGNLKLEPQQDVPENWRLEQHNSAKATISAASYKSQNTLLLKPTATGDADWHLQLNQGNLKIRKGQDYTVRFEAASESQRTIAINVLQGHDPWKNLGLYRPFTLSSQWKQYQFVFTAIEDNDNTRLSFNFGSHSEPFYIRQVCFQSGAVFTPDKDELLETQTVRLFGQVESKARQIDRMMFLADTEKTFFDDMRNYIKQDLGCKAMITGTIVFGPLGLYAQSDMDFIDAHAYWQHPRFPNKPWDSSDWLIDQKAMTDYPEQSTLMDLAAQRLDGKPYTVTEYNHPAPLDSQAQCVPMIASFAAAQNWDGIWLYTYSHSNNNWNRDFLNSYFDIDSNPAKWGFVPAGAAMFRFNLHSGLKPLLRYNAGGNQLAGIAELHLKYDRNFFNILNQSLLNLEAGWKSPCSRQIAVQFSNQNTANSISANPSEINWQIDPAGKGFYSAQNILARTLTGYGSDFEKITENAIRINSHEVTTLTITTLDSKPATESSKILITACGRCENTDMKFSDDRRTVGTHWGKGPVQIEAVEGIIDLTKILKDTTSITVFALNPDGTKKTEVPIIDGKIELSSKYATMWYLIEQ